MKETRECLKCKKEFQAKRYNTKFCSTSCRVGWNRKNKEKKDNVGQQVLINTLLEKLSMVDFVAKDAGFSAERNGTPQAISHTTKHSLWIEKSFQQHMNDLPDLETEYDYRNKAGEIEAATNITRKQKDLLLTNMRQSKL